MTGGAFLILNASQCRRSDWIYAGADLSLVRVLSLVLPGVPRIFFGSQTLWPPLQPQEIRK